MHALLSHSYGCLRGCVAATELCVFRCVSFGWRTFLILYEEERLKMKKILALTLASIMLMSLFGCSGGEDTQPQADNNPSSQQEETGRSKATEFTFELAAEEERVVENLIFDEDVTVSGDFGIIVFENCEFNGDIISTAEQFTRVEPFPKK